MNNIQLSSCSVSMAECMERVVPGAVVRLNSKPSRRAPRSICDVATTNSMGVWNDQDEIDFIQWATGTGVYRVYVQLAGGGGEVIVTKDGGREPRWASDGQELYFRKDDGLWAVPVTAGTRFSVGDPVLLFRGHFPIEEGGRNQQYDVFPNGDFLMLESPETSDELRIVVNWFDELARVSGR